jgi:cytochrome b pre-mRNA-processing protein 3
MLARRVAQKQYAVHRRIARQTQLRLLSTPTPTPTPTEAPKGPTQPYHFEKQQAPASWLTTKVKQTPWAVNFFVKLSSALGYGSKTQVAGRRTFYMYERVCSVQAEEDRAFWQDGEFVCSQV